jgi:uncharacterized protein
VGQVLIPLADGAQLAGDLHLPAGARPAPVIVCYYPYHKDDFIGAMYEAHANAYFVDHGYATLLVDFRGLAGSSGVALDAMHRQEGEDGAAIVGWAADQEWCDGNVGMWGLSYGGITSFKTAARKPPQLKAIVPIMGSLDIYHDWVYPGGCRNMLGACGVWGSWMLAMQLLPPMYQDLGGRWHEVWQHRLETGEPYLIPWAEHPDHGPYWEERAVDAAEIETPMLSIGAWRDLFPQVMVDAYAGASGPRKLLMGPWVHVHPDESDLAPIDHLHHMRRWFDRWLKDDRNGVEDEAPVQFYLQGEGRWVEADAWPPDAGSVRPRLGSDGTLRLDHEAPAGERVLETDPTAGTCAGLWDPFGLGIGYPLDQGPDDLASMTFTSEPLAAPLRIVGSPTASIRAAFSPGGEAQLVAKLVDVAPDGRAELITTGWLNARHRRSHAEPEDVVDGEPQDYVVPLWATAYTVAAGHRLRLSLGGGDFPRIWPSPRPQSLRVLCGGDPESSLTLPVAADDTIRDFEPEPQKQGVDRWPLHVDAESRWSVEHDLVEDATTVVSGARFVFDTPAEGGRIAMDHLARARVERARPDGANVVGKTVIEASMPAGERVEVSTSTLVTARGLALDGRVTVDGRTVFERSWTR